MFSRWPIQRKLRLLVGLLLASLILLAFSGFRGVYAYRELARSISLRANELPLAGQLSQRLSNLRITLSRARGINALPQQPGHFPADIAGVREEFGTNITAVEDVIARYKTLLDTDLPDWRLADRSGERATIDAIEVKLKYLREEKDDPAWVLNQLNVENLAYEVDEMYGWAIKLPEHLQKRMDAFAGDVRAQHRAWTTLFWASASAAVGTLGILVWLFYRWVAWPLNHLIAGSRRIAGGEFSHRVNLGSNDEMAELAEALNAMTARFQEIRDDLDRQVKERTKEVVRSERLAGVGFLAAGVAHEINNPLASIAWCAESLESRLYDILQCDEQELPAAQLDEVKVLRNYLRTIQEEAFRCKGITEKLLDYSRLGDMQKHDTDLNELVQGVIEMVRHLGKYRQKNIEFEATEYVVAPVNPQEIKQVLLNLITNGLDSLDLGGTVWVSLRKNGTQAELVITDNGCGMSDEVKEHLFEPFFTRRRDGSGTGLGLSITYRIVQDHGGRIVPHSDGPGQGTRMTVTLPLREEGKNIHERKPENRLQAA